MLAFRVVTLLIAVSSTGLVEGKCCVPNTWEGIQSTFTGSHTSSQESLVQNLMQLSYDATRKIVAMNLTSYVNGTPQPKTQVLIDYNQHLLYSWAGGSCNKTKYPTAFPSPCLPDTAQKVGNSFFGAGSDVLNFDTYLVTAADGTVVMASFTKPCIPVGEILYNVNSGGGILVTVGYNNITSGIKNPSVFTLPTICNKAIYNEDTLHYVNRIRRKNIFGF